MGVSPVRIDATEGRVQGAWAVARLEVDGVAMPPAALQSSQLLIDGDRFRFESPGANYEGVFNIDVEAQPHHIDIEFVEGPEAGNWNFGIFRIEGDQLEILVAGFELAGDAGRHPEGVALGELDDLVIELHPA